MLPDPRGHCNAFKYSLHDILVIALCASLCGAESFTEMAQFCELKRDWLQKELGLHLDQGTPSHDTIGRVFSMLNPEVFTQCFAAWTREIQGVTENEVIAVDGKTSRHSYDSAGGKSALHLVTAWASQRGLVLAQLAVDTKSNEITAVPALLALLEVKGCIVTVDALNTQKDLAGTIVERQGDYIFALKNNHRQLFEDVESHFEWALGQEAKRAAKKSSVRGKVSQTPLFHSQATTTTYDHGRQEIRRCCVVELEEGEWTEAQAQWRGLKSFVLVESERRVLQNVPKTNGESGTIPVWSAPSRERRYFLSSLLSSADRQMEAVRSHWGIENSVHWVLDVAFNEDDCRVRKDHAAPNLAIIRHTCLNLLREEKSTTRGIKAKRKMAGWDDGYLLKVVKG